MKKILSISFLILLLTYSVNAEETTLSYTDPQGDVFYFEDLQNPIELKSQQSVAAHPELDVVSVEYEFNRLNNSVRVEAEFAATPIFDSHHGYLIDLNYGPLSGDDTYSPIEGISVYVGWNRIGNISYASNSFRTVSYENSSYIPNTVEIQGNSLVADFPLVDNFPMTELFDESTTYHTILIDATFYVEGAGDYGPVYMDRMDIVPEEVESDDDFLSELPLNSSLIFGILLIPILRKFKF